MADKSTKENLEQESKIPVIFRGNLKEWLCKSCGFILGYSDIDVKVIRIKYKDLFIWIEGGRISNICRRCGDINELIDSDYKKILTNIKGKEVIKDGL